MPTPSETSPFPTMFCDDNNAVTWEHLEDVSTIHPKSEAKEEKRDPENEARSYHVEDVADMGSYRQSAVPNTSTPLPALPIIRITPCFDDNGEGSADRNAR